MAINFDSLPSDKPIATVEKGMYKALIEKAEMKKGQDPTKPEYLNLTFKLETLDGKPAGKLFDIITESNHELVLYKLKRFITALEIPLTGSFELKDLTKIIVNKQLLVDVTTEEKDGKPPRTIVDIFSGAIFYNMKELEQADETVMDQFVEPTNNEEGAPSY